MYHKLGNKHLSKIKSLLKGSGYKSGGDVAQDKALISDAIHKHEKHLHPGKPMTKLKSGGAIDAKKSHHRLDKLARGGKSNHKPSTKVNVIVAPQDGKQPIPVPVNRPVPIPVMRPAAAPVGGGLNSLPTTPTGEQDVMPRKKGGNCYKKGGAVKMTAGAASGEGRLEKSEIQEMKRK